MGKRILASLLAITLMITTLFSADMTVWAEEVETSGTLGENNGITWTYDAETKTITVTGEDRLAYDSYGPFQSLKSDVEKVILKNCTLSGSMDNLFSEMLNLKSVEFENVNTSGVTSMSCMFYNCKNLLSLDLSSFDTSNVTSMSDMFMGCSSLTSLDVSTFDTGNVTSMNSAMGGMFQNCSSLTSLDLSGFNTGNVKSFAMMFEGCKSLTSLDVSSFDTSSATNMTNMFYDCSSLTSLDVSSFDTSNVEYMNRMFDCCSSLTSLDLSSFDTGKVFDTARMFGGCSSLVELNLSSFDTKKISSMYEMFFGCSSLTELDLSSFEISKISYADRISDFLEHCTSLQTLHTPKICTFAEGIELPGLFCDTEGNEVRSITSAQCNMVLTKKADNDLTYMELNKEFTAIEDRKYYFIPEEDGYYGLRGSYVNGIFNEQGKREEEIEIEDYYSYYNTTFVYMNAGRKYYLTTYYDSTVAMVSAKYLNPDDVFTASVYDDSVWIAVCPEKTGIYRIEGTETDYSKELFLWKDTLCIKPLSFYYDTEIELKYSMVEAVEEYWSSDIAAKFSKGDGSQGNPYVISSAEELALLAKNVNSGTDYKNKYFELANDIILNDTEGFENWEIQAPEQEWIPIGFGKNVFEGIFDGKGNVISGLYQKNSVLDLGVFGKIGEYAQVKNLIVKDAYQEQYLGTEDIGIGAIVGNSKGQILNCEITGNYVCLLGTGGESRSLWICVGGLVGANCGLIMDCVNNSETTSVKVNEIIPYENSEIFFGGIDGYTDDSSISDNYLCLDKKVGIVNSYNNSNIRLLDSEELSVSKMGISVGGVSGQGYKLFSCGNYGEIQIDVDEAEDHNYDIGGVSGSSSYGAMLGNCFNYGDIVTSFENMGDSNLTIGGLVGDIGGDMSTPEISNCLVDSQIIIPDNVSAYRTFLGTVAGDAGNLVIDFCYWLYENNLEIVGEDSQSTCEVGRCKKLNDIEEAIELWSAEVETMIFKEKFPLDALRYWKLDEETGKPFLTNEVPDNVKVTIDWNEVENVTPWTGETANGFHAGTGTKDDPYQITTAEELAYLSESVSNGNSYKDQYIVLTNHVVLNDHYENYESWKEEWPENYWGECVIGTYEHPFEGNFDGKSYAIMGMYGRGLFGYVKDASISNIYVCCSYSDTICDFSGVVKSAQNSHIDSCIAAMYSVENTSCYPSKNLHVGTGGIVGKLTGGKVSNCTNYIELYNSDDEYDLGGIVGKAIDAEIVNCTNEAYICSCSETYSTGGIVGCLEDSKITGCINNGELYASYGDYGDVVGGVVGTAKFNFAIINCANQGEIGQTYFGGGIVSEVTDCLNGSIINCYNTGKINYRSDNFTGGIVGKAEVNTDHTLYIANCYNAGTVVDYSNNANSCGILGYAGDDSGYKMGNIKIENCYYLEGSAENAYICASNSSELCDVENVGTFTNENSKELLDSLKVYNMDKIYEMQATFTNWDMASKLKEWKEDMVGVNNGYPVLGEHDFELTEEGETGTWNCKNCDYSYIGGGVHIWDTEYTIDKPVTCSEDGSKSIHCSHCDEVKDVQVIPSQGHSWDTDYTVDKDATCGSSGSKSIHCKNCSETKDVTTINAKGHKWSEGVVTKSATCAEEGILTKTCSRCQGSKTETIEKQDHSWNTSYTVDKAATCGEAGSKSIHCKNCSETKDVTTIKAKNHSWDEGTVTKAATCTETGTLKKTCTNCSTTKTETIEKIDHSWKISYTVDKAATCTEGGSKSIHCKNCSETKDVTTIKAKGHSWDEGKVTKAASCTATGTLKKTCANCQGTKTETIQKTDHSWKISYTVDKAATCTAEGSKSIHCKNCSETKDVTTIKAKGHKWNEGTVTKAATCTTAGTLKKTCNTCKTTKTETIEKLGHSWNTSYTVDKADVVS